MANQFGFADELKYGFDDPQTAMRNALQDEGYNPYSDNPFMDIFMRAAPGMRTAFAMDRAGYGSQAQPDVSGEHSFGNYLRQGIRGGNMYGTLRSANEGMQRTIGGIRDYHSRLAAGEQKANLNPFTAYLDDLFKTDQGAGLTNAILGLRAPTLGSSQLASSYRQGLEAVQQGAVRRFADSPSGGKEGIWRYILGF